ncbi:hypothetical protein D3C83_207270 [compost metagenome]
MAIFDLGAPPGAIDEHHDEQPALPGRKPNLRTKLKRRIAVEKKRQKREKKAQKARAKNGA